MLRRALAERFVLRFHRESRDVPVYALTVAQGGFQLEGVDPEKAKERKIDTPWGLRKGVAQMGERGLYLATATSMTDFADWMSNMLDRPVLDQTGLLERTLRHRSALATRRTLGDDLGGATETGSEVREQKAALRNPNRRPRRKVPTAN